MSRRFTFETIRSEGALLPPDLLQRVLERDSDLGGLRGEDYGLTPNEPLNEAIVRSYNRLVGAWWSFQEARGKLSNDDPGTTITRDRFSLVLLQELGYGRVQTHTAVELEGKSYPVSHAWENVPLHLLGCNVPLGTRSKGVAGASTQSPHGILQELLNRSDERLWGVVSNGLELRLLRDNSSLTRQAFVSFDLEQMFDGDVYSDFALLWMLGHASRVEGERPHECWLERWSQEAQKQGTRALEGLRAGVEEAISALGSGFLRPGRNAELKAALRDGELSAQDYYRQLLRLVYRLLFLFVAEDRKLLHHPDASEEAKERYAEWYSSARLRRLAERRKGTKHADLWESLSLVMRSLGKDEGEPALGLPALASFLWSPDAIGHLEQATLPNGALLEAVRALATIKDGKVLRSVDYKNLGAEELGSVYESLLELHPELDLDDGIFALTTATGNERKTTGSYYTQTSLISVLLDSALDPVLEEAAAKGEEAILDLKVVDPACGSGHFLVAAAHRIAKSLASVRTGDEEPSPEATRSALRDVVSCCLYGVDVNPMAIELCKVSLWMEALDPGRPLSFLDAHVKCGNSLVGASVEMIDGGLPDGAFAVLEGDHAVVARSLRDQNKLEREGQLSLDDRLLDIVGGLDSEAAEFEVAPDTSLVGLREKERRFGAFQRSDAYVRLRTVADTWSAGFFQRKVPEGPRITTGMVRRCADDRNGQPDVVEGVRALSERFRFFHWQIEFPQVFGSSRGGFDVVVGNPPWGRVKLQEKQYWASRAPSIADAANKAARTRLLNQLASDEPEIYAEYKDELRQYEALSLYFHESNGWPMTGVGDVNTYSLFSELARRVLGEQGRAGLIVQQGIATDDTTKVFFDTLVSTNSLVAVYGFENEEKLFPAVHNQTKFCILVMATPRTGPDEIELSFYNRQTATVFDDDRLFRLSSSDFAAINPNTRTCPVFRSAADARVVRSMHRRFPVLELEGSDDGNPWGVDFQRMFDMANDSELFRTAVELEGDGWTRDKEIFSRSGERYLSLLEGKMVHLWNPRYGTYEGQTRAQSNKGVIPAVSDVLLADADYVNRPKYWVAEPEVEATWASSREWAIAFRDIGPLERTFLITVVPRAAVGHTLPLLHLTAVDARLASAFVAVGSSFLADYALRQRTAKGRMSFFVVKQLAFPGPAEFDAASPWNASVPLSVWLGDRALELTHTSWLTAPFAQDVGFNLPFKWLPERRFELQCEIDAAVFHLYVLERNEVEHVMDSFRLVRESEEAAYGTFRTKRLILEIYDELAEAIATGRPYQTRLDPPPADPSVAHRPHAIDESRKSVGEHV